MGFLEIIGYVAVLGLLVGQVAYQIAVHRMTKRALNIIGKETLQDLEYEREERLQAHMMNIQTGLRSAENEYNAFRLSELDTSIEGLTKTIQAMNSKQDKGKE